MSEFCRRPVIFGEVLYDIFPDEGSVLGGAPFNVAWHLQGFGMKPLMISGIGDDELGDSVLEEMENWGMDQAGIQRKTGYPTGKVNVSLVDGQPEYEILDHQAYDYIDGGKASGVIQDVDVSLVYQGTLAVRHDISRSACASLKSEAQAPVFIDINLRKPWWTADMLIEQIQRARWLKLNIDELKILSSLVEIKCSEIEENMRLINQELRVSSTVVTCGEEGAMMQVANDVYKSVPVQTSKIVDTVGAGDAFSAVIILGIDQSWDPVQMLSRSVAFASEITRIKGATPHDKSMYDRYLEEWELV